MPQGGGWCNDIATCVHRKNTHRGSSNYMERVIEFTGILSNKPEENPGFPQTESLYCLQWMFIFSRSIGVSMYPFFLSFAHNSSGLTAQTSTTGIESRFGTVTVHLSVVKAITRLVDIVFFYFLELKKAWLDGTYF